MTASAINPLTLKGGIVGFVIGSALFGGGVYLWMKKMTDDEISSVIKNFNDEINKAPDSETFKKEAEEIKKYAAYMAETSKETPQIEEATESFSTYKSYLADYEDDRSPDNSLVRERDSMEESREVVMENSIITEDEFGELPTFELFSLEFYPETNQLLDASDNSEIDEEDGIVDFTILNEFGSGKLDDPDIIYYRNFDNKMDLEIIRVLNKP